MANAGGPHHGYRLTDNAPLSSITMFFIHFWALFKKRARTARRDKRVVIFGTILPVLFLVLGIALLKLSSLNRNDSAIALTTSDYPSQSNTPLPYLCESDWMCDSVNQITQAVPQPLTSIGSPVYSTSTPTVFGVQYTNITATDPKSYSLKVGEEVFKRGFGVDTSPVQGQYTSLVIPKPVRLATMWQSTPRQSMQPSCTRRCWMKHYTAL
ncbi:unnamed protein product [Aphanomyces euteiches]